MTDYQFDACLVADEATFVRMPNAQVTVYDVADASNSTPLTLKDLNGLPLPNPMFSTADAFIPAFTTTVPQVKLVAGSFAIPHSSFRSLLDQATAAKTFVQGIGVLSTTTGAPGTNASVTIDTDGKFTFTIPRGATGTQGLPGVNAVPADTAVAGYANSTGTATRTALDALYANSGKMALNVKQFGAVGDGTADDTAAIQAALDAVPVGGASVFLPSGRYKVTSTLQIKQDGTTLYGEGAGYKVGGTQDARGSRIEAATGLTGSVLLVQRAANDRPLASVTLKDFSVDGGFVGTGVDGIVFRVNQGHMDRVHIWRASGVGLRVLGYTSPSWETYDTTFNNLIIGYNTGNGVVLDAKSSDTHWSHCIFLNNQDNFVITGGASVQVTGCHFYTPAGKNIFFNGSGARSKFANCKIEGASDHQFVIDTTNGGYSDIEITGCGFSSLNSAAATNTFDYIFVTGPSGNGVSRTLIVGNSFNLKGGSTVKARYAINLSTSAAQNTVIVGNSFGPASHWGTTAFNNATNSTLTTFVKGNFGLADITQVNVQTASYTAALTDADGVIEMNSASAVTVTIPTVATALWVKGATLTITQVGAGQVTISPAAGVTLRTARTLTTRAQWSTVRLRMRATNEWVLEGDLT